MSDTLLRDVVIDANVMRLYDRPKDKVFIVLFKWLRADGVLTVSQKLVMEYARADKPQIIILIGEMQREGRYNLISTSAIRAFDADRHFKYTCNRDDISHARTVFLSFRKKMISLDRRLVSDINKFKKIDGVKPAACTKPKCKFYA